jgi:hypothetical protein
VVTSPISCCPLVCHTVNINFSVSVCQPLHSLVYTRTSGVLQTFQIHTTLSSSQNLSAGKAAATRASNRLQVFGRVDDTSFPRLFGKRRVSLFLDAASPGKARQQKQRPIYYDVSTAFGAK